MLQYKMSQIGRRSQV